MMFHEVESDGLNSPPRESLQFLEGTLPLSPARHPPGETTYKACPAVEGRTRTICLVIELPTRKEKVDQLPSAPSLGIGPCQYCSMNFQRVDNKESSMNNICSPILRGLQRYRFGR